MHEPINHSISHQLEVHAHWITYLCINEWEHPPLNTEWDYLPMIVCTHLLKSETRAENRTSSRGWRDVGMVRWKGACDCTISHPLIYWTIWLWRWERWIGACSDYHLISSIWWSTTELMMYGVEDWLKEERLKDIQWIVETWLRTAVTKDIRRMSFPNEWWSDPPDIMYGMLFPGEMMWELDWGT